MLRRLTWEGGGDEWGWPTFRLKEKEEEILETEGMGCRTARPPWLGPRTGEDT